MAASEDGLHHVAVLAYADMSAFELGIVTEVFGVKWPGIPPYRVSICADGDGTVTTVGGGTLTTPHTLDTMAEADTVIVPSVADVHADAGPDVVAALRRARDRGARIVSVCTGSFALASAGLLEGRRATTHWLHTELLAHRFPRVHVDPAPLLVEADGIFTSAGSAAGIDLCLELVRRDHGAAVANALARRLVVAPHRDGGQAQYIESPVSTGDDGDAVAASMSWMLAHLAEQHTVASLARHCGVSPRTYLRRFTAATGTSPIRWLNEQRVHASLAALERDGSSVEKIAAAVGFDHVVTYRHHFRRIMRTSPTAYRRAFTAGSA
ncbi:AraC family transcriptional regulator [Saccharomonospora sp. CUA-673]|uniref:helix-turn-helix domain-containing protein n=1 Tax=Saccharomonospora sp. CUA-673 TaxID=1904969 RepID=UPI00095F43A4|nr:helix-turn-helix domain-containing protein [Saccharomonospora sp. CUA-673]OLT39009.1 AraC family transcriptional regulator [Saccharomonospora sp. CUA-673]